MSKKKKTEDKRSYKVKEGIPPPKEVAEKPFDFGGLPARDLKKNLGCG